MLRVSIVFDQIHAQGGLKSRGIVPRDSRSRIFRSVLTLAGATYGRKGGRERERERERESGRPEPVKVDGIGSAVDPMEGIVESSAEG